MKTNLMFTKKQDGRCLKSTTSVLRLLKKLSLLICVFLLLTTSFKTLEAQTWSSANSMTNARSGHTATLLPNGRVLVSGGVNSSGYLSSCELYNPITGTWSTTGSLSASRESHKAILLSNGKVLVVGGHSNSGNLRSCELYDPTSGTWTTTDSMEFARIAHTVTLMSDGKVMVAGGSDGNGLASCELYNPTTGIWGSTGSMVTVRWNHIATLLPNGKVLVAGGYNASIGQIGSYELYDPSNGTWSSPGRMAYDRIIPTSTLLPNGKAIVVGGIANSNSLRSCEIYDYSTDAWSSTGSMANGRYGNSATLFSNGKVLVVSGYGSGGFLNSCEIYDPSLGTWSSTVSLITARETFMATLLTNGKVLVTGGNGASGYLSSCEIYSPCQTAISSISVSPSNETNTGGVNTNLYIGYPTNNPSAALTANDGDQVIWSPASYLSCSACQSTVFTPTLAGNYTLTATNCYGSKTVTICVKDIRVPNTSGTRAAVYMCHKEPITNKTTTQAVLLRGIPSHFQYHSGDKLGVCGNTCATGKRDFDFDNLVIDEQYLEVLCTPNPFSQSFKLRYLSNSEEPATITIYGMSGNLVETITLEGVADEAELGTNLPNGIYTVSFIQGDKNRVFRMIKVE